MRYPEGSLRFKVAQWLAKKQALAVTGRLLIPKSYQPVNAILLFQALGPNARGAIPALVQMLHEPQNARPAVRALCAIGRDGAAAIGKALPTVADAHLRANILLELIYGISPELQIDLAPVLAQRLKDDSSYAVSMSAAQVLGTFTNAAAVAVPVLTAALRHRDGGTRLVAADSLGYFGREAASAVATLEATLNDENPQVRINATNALFIIQGTATSSGGRP